MTTSRIIRTRTALPAAMACLAIALTACGRGAPASGDVRQGPADTDADAVEIVAVDDAFEPDALEIEAGSTVTIEVSNEGARPHNLVIESLDLSTGTLEPGDVATATFEMPDTAVTYVCTFHSGMQGTLQPITT